MKFRTSRFASILIALALLSTATTPSETLDRNMTVEQFKWKNRLIVLIATSPQHGEVKKQKHLLSDSEAGLIDRDLRLIEIYSSTEGFLDNVPLSKEDVLKLRIQLVKPGRSFQFLLVGKDGTVKLRSNEAVEPSEIFALIDLMPMRRQEMKRDQG